MREVLTKGENMSKKEQGQNSSEQKPHSSSNVVSIVVDRCKAEGCKSKQTKAGFCDEHFIWFKEGLVTVDGHHAKDFEKKYQNYMNRQRKAS